MWARYDNNFAVRYRGNEIDVLMADDDGLLGITFDDEEIFEFWMEDPKYESYKKLAVWYAKDHSIVSLPKDLDGLWGILKS